MASIYMKLEKFLKQAKEAKHKLKSLEFRRESDGSVTLISDRLEITVRRKQHEVAFAALPGTLNKAS